MLPVAKQRLNAATIEKNLIFVISKLFMLLITHLKIFRLTDVLSRHCSQLLNIHKNIFLSPNYALGVFLGFFS